MKVAVIGIGQSTRGDDAAGPEAVRLWASTHAETSGRADIRVEFVEQPGFELLDALRDVGSAVLVDALAPGSHPGAVRRLDIADLDLTPESGASLHGWGVGEVLSLGRALGSVHSELQLRCLGIEAEHIGVAAGLSRSVTEALHSASNSIQDAVQGILGE